MIVQIKKELSDWWVEEVKGLVEFFKTAPKPSEPIYLTRCQKIDNYELFISSHIATCKRNVGKEKFLPYILRLKKLRKIIQDEEKTKC